MVDKATILAARRELKRRAAGMAFAPFVAYTTPGYQMGWVHEEVCKELDQFLADVQAKKAPRLMLTMPPRHGKSELASRKFPAYALGRNPDLSIIASSYSADLSSRMSRDVQRTIESAAYQDTFPATTIAGMPGTGKGRGIRTSELFEVIGRSGSYRAAGVGGGITGMGADIAIIDDPFKDRATADSATIRDNVWDWYASTLYTRLSPGGGVLLIMTRWHMDDLAGRLLAAQVAGDGDTWRVVNYPAIAEQDEPHRKIGEALHEERYPLERLHAIRKAIGSRDWEALYQQHPVPDGGCIFREEWLRFYLPAELPVQYDACITSWDMAFKESDDSDFVVGQVWGLRGANRYLLDQVRGRWGFVETVRQFRKLTDKWKGVATRHLIEDKANGPAVIDALRQYVSGIVPVEPDGSKVARASAVTTAFEAGNVLLPDPRVSPWVNELKTELMQFPSVAHDDQVDALSQALRDLEKLSNRGWNFGDDVMNELMARSSPLSRFM